MLHEDPRSRGKVTKSVCTLFWLFVSTILNQDPVSRFFTVSLPNLGPASTYLNHGVDIYRLYGHSFTQGTEQNLL